MYLWLLGTIVALVLLGVLLWRRRHDEERHLATARRLLDRNDPRGLDLLVRVVDSPHCHRAARAVETLVEHLPDSRPHLRRAAALSGCDEVRFEIGLALGDVEYGLLEEVATAARHPWWAAIAAQTLAERLPSSQAALARVAAGSRHGEARLRAALAVRDYVRAAEVCSGAGPGLTRKAFEALTGHLPDSRAALERLLGRLDASWDAGRLRRAAADPLACVRDDPELAPAAAFGLRFLRPARRRERAEQLAREGAAAAPVLLSYCLWRAEQGPARRAPFPLLGCASGDVLDELIGLLDGGAGKFAVKALLSLGRAAGGGDLRERLDRARGGLGPHGQRRAAEVLRRWGDPAIPAGLGDRSWNW